jgi:hypothetical protein
MISQSMYSAMLTQFDAWQLTTPCDPQRNSLIRFWLCAPFDQVQSLWNIGFGEVTRKLVKELDRDYAFSAEQVTLRNEINERITKLGLPHPLSPQLLIASFLLSPPTLLKVAQPHLVLPGWLSSVYTELYETPFEDDINPSQQTSVLDTQTLPEKIDLPNPDYGDFPESLDSLIGNRVQLNRILGLSNLYYIDPEDAQITRELILTRHSLSQLIIRHPSSDLERIWLTEFGDRYWALVRSGIQDEVLGELDYSIRDSINSLLKQSHDPKSPNPGFINAFLVALMFYPVNSIRIADAHQKLPEWLYSDYKQLLEQSPVIEF